MTVDPRVRSWATYDASGGYRYDLGRVWDESAPVAVWIMLNPSAANATHDDPTMRRVTGFTRREGLGGFVAVNLSAYCTHRPIDLRLAGDDVVDATNEAWVASTIAERSGPVIAAWGASATRLPCRPIPDVIAHLCDGDLWCFGTTKDGHPRHPLYLRGDTPLERWKPSPGT